MSRQSGPAAPDVGESRTGRAVVLVIDDEPVINRLVERSLEDRAEVLQEYGAPEPGAIDFEGVDLVILDYQMPIRDGLEVLEEIRSEFPKLPVLFLTGFGSPEIAEKAVALGATRFMTKPVEPSRLRRAFEELVRNDRKETPRNSLRQYRGEIPSICSSRGFRAANSSGRPIVGEVLRFSHRSVHVEIPRESDLESGEKLRDICFLFGRQEVRAVEGIVSLFPGAGSTVVEGVIQVSDHWNVTELEGEGDAVETAEDPSEHSLSTCASLR